MERPTTTGEIFTMAYSFTENLLRRKNYYLVAMIGFFIIIAINIAAGIITFVSYSGKIIDRHRKGLNVIRKGGWVLIGCFISTIGLTIFQYNKIENHWPLAHSYFNPKL